MKRLTLCTVPVAGLLLAASDVPVADAYPKNPAIDVLNYAFHLELSDNDDVIRGRAAIDLAFPGADQSELRFDLVSPFDSAGGEWGMRVSGVRVAEAGGSFRAASYTHRDDVLRVALDRSSEEGDRLSVEVEYAGVPATGLRIGPNKHGDRTFFSDNWPNRARHWLPTVDHPYDKATNEFIVTAPARYQIISNGLLIEETDRLDGTRLTHWRQSVPIASWLFVLGAAEFAVQHVDDYEGKEIQTWVYARDRDAGFYDFAVPTKQAMEFYGDYVGPFAYEKLANVQSASVGGGMEAATAIFYAEGSVTGERSVRWRNVIIHEVAHQWFGNAVTEYDWDDIWLSEGFATYFTLLFIEHAYGRDEFVDGLRSAADRVWGWYDENPDYRIVHDGLQDMRRVTSVATYQKGAWVLHMLRGMIGDEAFWAGIRAYYAAHMNGSATTDDFRMAMEEASGRELGWFFQQWLYQGGNPSITGTWRYDESSGSVVVDVEQGVRDGRAFRLPMQLGLYDGERRVPEIHERELTGERHRFTIPVDAAPTRVELDPLVWTLFRGGLEPAG